MAMNELEQRSLKFAKEVRDYCKSLKFNTVDEVYIKQVIRSSSSIGANYIEANEKLGKQDLIMKLRIARKEAKETQYWLALLDTGHETIAKLIKEAEELRKIMSAIINKIQQNQLA
jgi:four helix bundle protein